MQNSILKKIIIFTLIGLSVLAIYFGSYLPFNKAQEYIYFTSSLNQISTLEQFKELGNGVIRFYSPVGQEEVVRFISRDIVNMIRNPNQKQQIADELVKFIEPNINKRNERHLLTMGEMYSVVWDRYRNEDYYVKAIFYYTEALKIGSNLPPVLYPLFDLYRIHGDSEKATEIKNKILTLWPEEKRISQ